jgi:hypothetical protein
VDRPPLPRSPTRPHVAPTHSHRQETASSMRTRQVGIRCIRRARVVCQKPFPSPNTSSANMLMNTATTMHNALGAQYDNWWAGLRFPGFAKR